MSNSPALSNYFSHFRVDFNPSSMSGLDPELLALVEAAGKLAEAAEDFAGGFAQLVAGRSDAASLCVCAPVSPPEIEDSCHPSGSLRTSGDTIDTPGGYRIEMVGQYEWKITGPDGKSTRVWGDPHVDEGDREGGNDWDFKRNSTFVLGDGTRVNVRTVPGGAEGMTVTGSLEIISGNDRVVVTGIDAGKGQIGPVTQDGFEHVNSFQGDVFVMGGEADDWSYQGREITGSEKGGDALKTGGAIRPDFYYQGFDYEAGMMWAMSLFSNLFDAWQPDWRPNSYGCNPYWNSDRPVWQSDDPGAYDRERHAENLAEALRAVGVMFTALAAVFKLSEQVSNARRRHSLAV
ncbi:MAG TPA: DUF1521 domain-containing protein [Pyrinomonadaceae bacterium]|nr:DUF1521 domain-containing protein [Pyrinomonadaceae bacterium]